MQSSFVNTSYMSRSSRVKPQRDGNLIHVTGGNELARFNRMADSDAMHQDYAAELLLQMHRIATNEVLQSSPQTINTMNDTSVHLISPIHRPKERSIKILPAGSGCLTLPNCAVPSDSSTWVSTLISQAQADHSSSSLLSSSNASSRFRTVSIGGLNDVAGKYNDDWRKSLEMNNIVSTKLIASGSVSPLQLGLSHVSPLTDTLNDSSSDFTVKQGFVVTPDKSKKLVFEDYTSTKSPYDRYRELIRSSSKDSYDHEEYDDNDTDDESTMDYVSQNKRLSRKLQKCEHRADAGLGAMCTSNKKKNIISNPSSPFTHKYVGETVAPNVKIRDVLRKKFSWKSFPELEIYLINHRKQYLECSNAMNYTKAQKNYNNELTQGLLQLAANEGYVFEEFTFAAVRDRIRCFYKSFVQATKKKKRVHHHSKQQQH
jgi:hypothetical protein